jgi:hypothetical protein
MNEHMAFAYDLSCEWVDCAFDRDAIDATIAVLVKLTYDREACLCPCAFGPVAKTAILFSGDSKAQLFPTGVVPTGWVGGVVCPPIDT